jgi:lysophospholipase L1-like esterase
MLYVLLAVLAATFILEAAARGLRGPTLAVVVRREAEDAGSEGIVQATGDARVFAARPRFGDDTYSIDSRGLRGPDRPRLKEPGVRRLLLLGDSVAFGQGMAEDEYIAPLLQTELQRGDEWEVWNVSFPGWNTAQEAAALAVFGAEIQPDRVLVLWVPNDGASLEHQRFGGDGAIEALYSDERLVPLGWPSQESQIAAWRRSALVRLFFDWRGMRLGDGQGAGGAGQPDGSASLRSIGLADLDYRAALASLAEQAESLGVPLEIAMLPPLIDYPGWAEPAGPGRPVASYVREPAWRVTVALCAELGLRCVDLGAAIVPRRPSTLQIRPGDSVHPSAEGHALIAKWLGQRILRQERVGELD